MLVLLLVPCSTGCYRRSLETASPLQLEPVRAARLREHSPARQGWLWGWLGGVLVSCAPGRGCGAPGAQWAVGYAFLAVHCSVEEHSGAPKLLAAEWWGCLSEGLRVWLGSCRRLGARWGCRKLGANQGWGCRRLGELLPSPLPSLHVLSSLQPPCSVAGCRRKRFLSPMHGDKELLARGLS